MSMEITMKYKPYPAYKESGVEWLGDVPEHWEVIALKRIASLKSGETINSDSIEETGDFPVFGGNGFRGYTTSYTHEGTYALIGRQGALCGNINYTTGKFWASEHAVVASPVHNVETYWLGELLRAMNLNQYSISAAQPGLSVEIVGNLRIPFPPSAEQHTIAAFLDRETAKIDTLIAKQERLIELLQEKRTALISHAVTKGLNPDAPMKESRIEWLGEVPEHWNVGAIKHFVRSGVGAIKTGPFGSQLIASEMECGDIKVYNQRNVIDRDFESGDNYVTKEKFAGLSAFELYPGDVLVTTRGTIGRAAILPDGADRGILHPCLLRIQPDTRKLTAIFLETLLQASHLLKTQVEFQSNATTIDVIYSYTIANVVIPVPPVWEQEEILSYLTTVIGKLDTLITKARRAIDLLKERRTALISAAVTGKIDVREIFLSVTPE